jgi:hypothetical protein
MTPILYVGQRSLLLICLLSYSLLNFAQQSPSYIWGRAIGIMDRGDLSLSYGVVDVTGNIYMAGSFNTSADFDPGPDSTRLTTMGDYDAFVCKFNSSGNLVWAIQLGGVGADRAACIKRDLQGNIYVTGSFSGTVDFDPGAGTASLSAAAGTDAFVAKYDAAGNYIWAMSFAESDNSTGKAVAVDPASNVYVTGNFSGVISFTTGTSYTSLGGNDVFICKLTSNGSVVWAQRIDGTSLDKASGIAADATGNVFTCGMYESGTIDLDPGPDSIKYETGSSHIYLVKLNASGGLIWAIENGAITANDLKLDATGNLFLVGGIYGVNDFDPGPGTANVGFGRRFNDYFWELNNDCGYVLAKAYLGISATGDTKSVNVDATGNMYTAGGQGDFNKWDRNGNAIWGYGYGVNNPCLNIATDAMQNVYTMGNYHGFIDLDPGPDTVNVRISSGIFFNKLSQLAAGPLPITWINVEGHLNDLQQSTLNFTVNEENVERYTVEKSTDGVTLQHPFKYIDHFKLTARFCRYCVHAPAH